MNLDFAIGFVDDNLDTDRFDALGEGMTRRFLRSGENTRPDGSGFISQFDELTFRSKIRNVPSLTQELERRVNDLVRIIGSSQPGDTFSIFISIAAYHQDDQHIDVSLSEELIKTLNDHKIGVDISIYRYCPW